MGRVHRLAKAGATLVLSKGFMLPVGVAEVSEGLVTSVREKPTYDISITTGNMIINRKAISQLLKMSKKTQNDLMKNFIPLLLENDTNVASYYVKEFWYDIGTVDKYLGLKDTMVEKHLGFLYR